MNMIINRLKHEIQQLLMQQNSLHESVKHILFDAAN